MVNVKDLSAEESGLYQAALQNHQQALANQDEAKRAVETAKAALNKTTTEIYKAHPELSGKVEISQDGKFITAIT